MITAKVTKNPINCVLPYKIEIQMTKEFDSINFKNPNESGKLTQPMVLSCDVSKLTVDIVAKPIAAQIESQQDWEKVARAIHQSARFHPVPGLDSDPAVYDYSFTRRADTMVKTCTPIWNAPDKPKMPSSWQVVVHHAARLADAPKAVTDRAIDAWANMRRDELVSDDNLPINFDCPVQWATVNKGNHAPKVVALMHWETSDHNAELSDPDANVLLGYTLPDYRRFGIYTKVYEAAKLAMKEDSISNLWSSTKAKNVFMQKAFDKRGAKEAYRVYRETI